MELACHTLTVTQEDDDLVATEMETQEAKTTNKTLLPKKKTKPRRKARKTEDDIPMMEIKTDRTAKR
jgi:hypothetical protein